MTRDARRSTTETAAFDECTGYYAFSVEEEDESRRTHFAITGALIFHLLLFIAPLGFLKPSRVAAESTPRNIFVITQTRFKPPPPEVRQMIPEPLARRVPIPDPTPDEPEPLRLDEEIRREHDLPDIAIVSGIPETPPPFVPNRPIRFGGDVTRPLKVSGPTPQYTEIARKARIEGVVILEAIIDKGGYVTNVKVLRPLPLGLDQAATDAVGKWRFEPATLNGTPVDVLYNLTVKFRLQ